MIDERTLRTRKNRQKPFCSTCIRKTICTYQKLQCLLLDQTCCPVTSLRFCAPRLVRHTFGGSQPQGLVLVDELLSSRSEPGGDSGQETVRPSGGSLVLAQANKDLSPSRMRVMLKKRGCHGKCTAVPRPPGRFKPARRTSEAQAHE